MSQCNANRAADLNVAIIGGSIAGCAAAIELSRAGCEVTLFERSGEQLKDRGAGIGVPASLLETFIARDLVDRDIAYYPAHSFSRIWRTARARRYGYLAWDQPAELAALNWGALYRNLRKRVADTSYRTQQQVVALQPLGEDRAGVQLADGSAFEFDLVVCADGYTSLGRRTLFPEVELAYAGYVLWRGCMLEVELGESAPLASGIRCTGFPGGHGIFYFVPGPHGSLGAGTRLVNWGVYVALAEAELGTFLTDVNGQHHVGSLPPGSMPPATEDALKAETLGVLPDYYADIVARSRDTFAYAIYDCEVPAYSRGRICLAGDAGAYSRPHSGAGALKGINDVISLATALADTATIDAALARWDAERTAANNQLVRFGNQLGRAFVEEIPDWSQMDEAAMQRWFDEVVTIRSNYILSER